MNHELEVKKLDNDSSSNSNLTQIVVVRRERAFESLNADLGEVSRWGDVNRRTFSSGKTQYIAFTNRASITNSSIQFIGSSIPCSSSIEILELGITKNLSWTEQSFLILFIVVVPKGVWCRLIVVHLTFLLAVYIHARDHFFLI